MQITTKTNLLYKVKSDDTIFSICKTFKVDSLSFKMLNNINIVKQNMYVLLPSSYNKVYVVKPLDTLELVAKKLGVSTKTLLQNIKTKTLYVGQKIIF